MNAGKYGLVVTVVTSAKTSLNADVERLIAEDLIGAVVIYGGKRVG